jgi:hypothetical protein
MSKKSRFEHPNTNRVDALTDGVFAIAATLLVFGIQVPKIPPQHTQKELIDSLLKVLPSFIALLFHSSPSLFIGSITMDFQKQSGITTTVGMVEYYFAVLYFDSSFSHQLYQ